MQRAVTTEALIMVKMLDKVMMFFREKYKKQLTMVKQR